MVTHWKSHVKQQRANMAAAGGSLGRGRGRPGMPPGRGRGRGRGAPGRPGRGAGRPPGRGIKKEKKEGRSDKGKPRWTAYLLWSTRRYCTVTKLYTVLFKNEIERSNFEKGCLKFVGFSKRYTTSTLSLN